MKLEEINLEVKRLSHFTLWTPIGYRLYWWGIQPLWLSNSLTPRKVSHMHMIRSSKDLPCQYFLLTSGDLLGTDNDNAH